MNMFFRIFLFNIFGFGTWFLWVFGLGAWVFLGLWVWVMVMVMDSNPNPNPKPNKTQTTSSVSLDTLGIKRLSVVNAFNYFFLKYLNNTEILKNH
jgi:hypothetical protein